MNKNLFAIKSYATEENVVFLRGDIVEVLGIEEGSVDLIGIEGWCEGIEITLSTKTIGEHFSSIKEW